MSKAADVGLDITKRIVLIKLGSLDRLALWFGKYEMLIEEIP